MSRARGLSKPPRAHIYSQEFTYPHFDFSKYYRADWKPYPYVLWDALMVALQQVLPVEAAGKLLLILTTVLLPIAVAWFLWQANRTEIKFALLGCALSYSSLFLYGFCAYQLSVVLCFLMVGTWLWYRRKSSVVRAVLFLAICAATYLAHLLGFATAALVLILYELTCINWREMLRLACFLAPWFAISVWARPGIRGDGAMEWQSIPAQVRSLGSLPVHGYHKSLDEAFLGGLILCLLVAVVRNRELQIKLALACGNGRSPRRVFSASRNWGTDRLVGARLVPPLSLLTLSALRIGRRGTGLPCSLSHLLHCEW